MKKTLTALAIGAMFVGAGTAAGPLDSASRAWTYQHSGASGFLSEIVSFDSLTKTLWVAGVSGVDVLDAASGSPLQRIDVSSFGTINSVAIRNGVAAFAIESSTRTDPGVVKLYDTSTRSLLSGTNTITVGVLPDMLTFTPNGSKLLVANEGTPSTYGPLTSTPGAFPRTYGPAALDPVGSVSIIDMGSRTVSFTATLTGVAQSGSHIRTNTGIDFEPEYIAVNKAGTRAYVSLQEANAMGVLDVTSGQFTQVIGLGAKDFSTPGNRIDPLNNNTAALASVNVKGLYMPDGMATYETGGKTFVLMANEGDFREDDGDRSTAGSAGLNAASPLNNLRVSNTDSSAGNLFAAGGRSFSIRDESGNLVFDSGEILDREAMALGIYNDARSRDKGVEPESVEVIEIGNKAFAFIGLERTAYNNNAELASNYVSAIAVFDITDPANSSFVRMLKTDGDMAPEGLKGFSMNGRNFLAYSNEVSNTTTLYDLAPVPEPATWALMLGGLAGVGVLSRRRATPAG